uniref:Biogenesis of lysosome-related organelles complex 1 subunit 2 n=1 Tax=Araucaria cunninghamii TaxID=56994 RepID=A0A0D6R776_ARACU
MDMEKQEDKEKQKQKGTALGGALFDLFRNVSSLVEGELQGTNNLLELIEKMNLRTADEYNNFGDIAAGLCVFVEQLKMKNESFHEYIQQIDEIDQQVTELEAVISMLDKYSYTLESKVHSIYGDLRPK